MYYYLSFLRPPPVSVAASERSVVISGQICNDLRTESVRASFVSRSCEVRADPFPFIRLLDDRPVDIYFTWRCSPARTAVAEQFPSQKLTTWDPPRSTYSLTPVPFPRRPRCGESWKLGLSTAVLCGRSSGPYHAVNGALPLRDGQIAGVWSEAISVVDPDEEAIAGSRRHAGRPSGERSASPVRSPRNKSRSVIKGKAPRPKSRDDPKPKKQETHKQTQIWRIWDLPPELNGVHEVSMGTEPNKRGDDAVPNVGRTEASEGTSTVAPLISKPRCLSIVEDTSYDLDKVSV